MAQKNKPAINENQTNSNAAKIAIFIAFIVAGILGAIILWKKAVSPEPVS